MSINGQASTVFANTISGLDTLNVSNITVNGVDLTATYVPYQNANSDVNLGIRNLTGTSIIATTSMTTPTPTLSDNSTLVSTTAFVKSQGYIGTAGLANYALLSGATFTGPISTTNISVSGTSSIAGYVSDTSLNTTLANYLTNAFANATFLTISNASGTYALITSLSNYLLTSTFNSTIANYVLTASLNSILTNYLETSTFNSTIANYVLTSSLNLTLANYALKSGTTFTGPVYGMTAPFTDYNDKFATTAYVKGQNYITSSALGPYAQIASPTFTGTPSAPTPSTSDNTTTLATTQYVKNNLANYAPLINATFTTPFRVNGATSGSLIVDTNGNVSCTNIEASNADFATIQIRGGGIVNPVNALLGIDTTTGYIWRTTGSAIATVTTTSANVNYSIIGTDQNSGALASAYIDAIPTSFYFNPSTGILTAPSITTTATSSIFGYLTTASASATYAPISILSNYALLVGASFTGFVNGLTADLTDDNTKFATTAFVKGQGYYLKTGGLINGNSIQVVLDGNGNNNPSLWSSSYSLFGPNVSSTTSSAVAITYNTASNYGALLSLKTGSLKEWRDMHYCANNHFFKYNGDTKAIIDILGTITLAGGISLTGATPPDFRIIADGINFYLSNNQCGFWDKPDANTWRISAATAVNMSLNAPTTLNLQIGYNNILSLDNTYITANKILRLNGGSGSSGQIHINNGIYNLIFRQDTSEFYFLIGTAPDGGWNSLRPFYISLASGLLSSINGQRFTGGTEISTSCLLTSGVNLRMATGNGDTGLAMEIASSTTPIINLQSNFRGTTNTAYLGACFRIDTRNSPLYQWFYRPAGSGTENMIMNLNSAGDLGCSTLTLSSTSQQTYSPKQVLIGQNGSVLQYGQLESFSFICGGGGFGWGPGLWMNTNMGQFNNLVMVIPNRMVKNTASSAITITGTWSGYLGPNLMICSVYLYNYFAGGYYFVGNGFQYQNIGGNHALGGFTKTIPANTLPAGEYLLYLQSNFGTATDTNDYCTFNAIIHP